MRKVVYIYALLDPRDKRIRYVGKTNNLKRRYEQHIYEHTGINPRKERWINGLRKGGLLPEIKVVEECTVDNWQERERSWISKCREEYDDLINLTDGGDGNTSESWREICVEKTAKRHKKEIKKCYVCGGKTICHFEICSKCLRNIDPNYLESDWYLFLQDNYESFYRRNKRNEDKFVEYSEEMS